MRLDQEQSETDGFANNRPKPRKKHSCLKFFFGLILVLIIVLACLYFNLKFMIGPIIEKVDQLPGDFPQALSIYRPEQAEIRVQTDEGRKKILSLIDSLPDWMIKPLLNYLSNDLKTKLNRTFDESRIPQNFTAEDLKKALSNIDPEQIKTVSLSWDAIDQTKEQIASYYQKKLIEANFQLKENLTDYEINLGFVKDDIFGQISFKDTKATTSQVQMIINYLAK